MDKTRLDKLRVALKEAKIDDLLVDRFIDGALRSCNESCYSGCAACC